MTIVDSGDEERVVELDENHEPVWTLYIRDLFGDEWDSYSPAPPLLDVQGLEGGNVLVTLYNVGILEANREGEVVWRLDDPEASHDADRLPNGNTIYERVWAAQGERAVIEVDPDGNEVWSWDGVDDFGDDPRFAGFVDEGGGWSHVNSIQRLENGHTILCVRNWNMILEVDEDARKVSELTFDAPDDTPVVNTDGDVEGERPHGAELRPDGSLYVNLRSPQRAVALVDGAVVWETPSLSGTGMQDIDELPTGGWLVVAQERIWELDADENIVWDWDSGVDVENSPHVFAAASRLDLDGLPTDLD
jgi:hypothetical protein